MYVAVKPSRDTRVPSCLL